MFSSSTEGGTELEEWLLYDVRIPTEADKQPVSVVQTAAVFNTPNNI